VVLTGCLGGPRPPGGPAALAGRARTCSATLRRCSSPGHLFVELQDHGLWSSPSSTACLLELAGSSTCRSWPPTTRTTSSATTRARSAPSPASRRGEPRRGRGVGGSEEMFLKSPRGDGGGLRGLPRGARQHAAHRGDVQAEARARQAHAAELPRRVGATSSRTSTSTSRASAAAGPREALRELQAQGKRFDEANKYRDRLEIEVKVICGMKFPGYFLIVQDFINWGKRNGVPVGPGRGSGAGLARRVRAGHHRHRPHPLRPPLRALPQPRARLDARLRRRLLHAQARARHRVRAQKYGADSVGQIATFQVLKAKSCVRDVGRVMGMPFADVTPSPSSCPTPCRARPSRSRRRWRRSPSSRPSTTRARPRATIDMAMKLENLNRHAGMHAAGIVISEGPLWDTVPVFKRHGASRRHAVREGRGRGRGAGEVRLPRAHHAHGARLRRGMIRKRPDEIERVAKGGRALRRRRHPARAQGPRPREGQEGRARPSSCCSRARRPGCFSSSRRGCRSSSRTSSPTASRTSSPRWPSTARGPSARAWSRTSSTARTAARRSSTPTTDLKEVLEDTYGVIVYQEQVMMIARKMGGYSLGGADLLRRAMGKKKAEEMAKQKATFVDGAKKLGYDEAKAVEVFDLLEYFAGYGFNKSHSAAYALITYQTAFLKRHFPAEFMAATLCSDLGKIEKLVGYHRRGAQHGHRGAGAGRQRVRPVFTVVYAPTPQPIPRKPATRVEADPWRPRIRVGLGGIKGVGDSAIENIIEAREAGPSRTSSTSPPASTRRGVNKGVVEALVASRRVRRHPGAHRRLAQPSATPPSTRRWSAARGPPRSALSGQMGALRHGRDAAAHQRLPRRASVGPHREAQARARGPRALPHRAPPRPLRHGGGALRHHHRRDPDDGQQHRGDPRGRHRGLPREGAQVGRAHGLLLSRRPRRARRGHRAPRKVFDDLAGKHEGGRGACCWRARSRWSSSATTRATSTTSVPEQQLERKLMVERLTPLGDALRRGGRAHGARRHRPLGGAHGDHRAHLRLEGRRAAELMKRRGSGR
jgi:DNA polymerase-3 subunit alpha